MAPTDTFWPTYLTAEEKAYIQGEWGDRRAGLSDVTSPGTPDPDIFPLCDALNAIEGVCTVQSCAGHRSPEPKSWDTRTDGDGLVAGQLWLRLSADMLHAFERSVGTLLLSDEIEQVSLIWGRHRGYTNGPVVDIVFRGNERGQLHDSERVLLGFFREIAGRAEALEGRC